MNLTAEQPHIASFEGVRLTALHLRIERRPSFYYINGIHEQAYPAKKLQAKMQTVKKQIPVLQLCRYPVIGWKDAPPDLFGLRTIQIDAT
jgi:hypothetical protein